MSDTARAVLVGLLVLSAGVWIGGYVAIGVVARVAGRTLDRGVRIAFFRALGRAYGGVGTLALLIALGTGASLLSGRAWDGLRVTATVLAAALLVATMVGMAQARRMTRLRRAAVAAPEDAGLAARVRSGATSATVLRAGIGLLTLALVAVAALLAA